MDILSKLIETRKSKKISQGKVAMSIGMSQSSLSAYENGVIDIPFRRILDYARVMRCKIVLFDEDMIEELIN